MSADEKAKCKRCHTELQGRSELCVSCYRWLHHACPNCMIQTPSGLYSVKQDKVKRKPIDCSVCCNERWVIFPFKPLPIN